MNAILLESPRKDYKLPHRATIKALGIVANRFFGERMTKTTWEEVMEKIWMERDGTGKKVDWPVVTSILYLIELRKIFVRKLRAT